MIFSFGQIWPLKTQLCACLRIDYENMAFFLRKNHWVKIWGGGEHFHFWPQTWVVKMDVFGHRGQIWPDQNFFGPPSGRHQNSGRNEVWNTSETQKLTEIWLKPFFSENAKKIMDFGGLVCSGSSWELILGFLSGPNASWVSVLPTKPAGKVWATSKKFFGGVVQIPWKASMHFILMHYALGCMEVHPGVSSLNLVTATKSYATFYISDFLWSNSWPAWINLVLKTGQSN